MNAPNTRKPIEDRLADYAAKRAAAMADVTSLDFDLRAAETTIRWLKKANDELTKELAAFQLKDIRLKSNKWQKATIRRYVESSSGMGICTASSESVEIAFEE